MDIGELVKIDTHQGYSVISHFWLFIRAFWQDLTVSCPPGFRAAILSYRQRPASAIGQKIQSALNSNKTYSIPDV